MKWKEIEALKEEPTRYPVIRTTETEERQPLPRRLVLRRDNFRCTICGNGGLLEVDHIVPWSAGGSDDMDNLRTLCRQCNQDRSNFKYPIDQHRRIPNGGQCVHCCKYLIGEPDIRPIYCITCKTKAPGLPFRDDPDV